MTLSGDTIYAGWGFETGGASSGCSVALHASMHPVLAFPVACGL